MQTSLNQFSDALAEVVERVSASTVMISARPRFSSSGVVWSPGVVVTADHTIQHDEVRVRLSNGTEAKATVAGRDRATDIAVLRLESGMPLPAFADPRELRAGNLAVAAGRTEQGVTATMGIVSTAAGPWRTWRGGLIDRFIRLDMGLYPSSSGAAVAGADGAVFGIATSGLSRTSAIAIPKSTIDPVVADLLRSGRVSRAYLGVGLQPVPLTEHLKQKLNLSQNGGVIVLSVEPDGPAQAGGVLIGDIFLELNARSLEDTDDVQASLGTEKVGASVKLKVLRGGEVTALEIKVGERPRKE
jgi:S1-C subfamily serine protease